MRVESVELLRVSTGPQEREGFTPVALVTREGTVSGRVYGRSGRRGIVWIGGVGGGWDSPALGLYRRLSRELTAHGFRSIRIRFRNPFAIPDCVHDVAAGISFLASTGSEEIAIVGHSMGGAVAIAAALPDVRVRTVVAISPQTYGAEGVEGLGERCPILFLHGSADPVLPPGCSEFLHRKATGEKRLVIYPGGDHLLDQDADEVTEEVRRWLLGRLGSSSGSG